MCTAAGTLYSVLVVLSMLKRALMDLLAYLFAERWRLLRAILTIILLLLDDIISYHPQPTRKKLVPLYDECKWHLTHNPPALFANRNEFQTNDTINPAWVHMGSAVAAGIVADVLCNPAFVVRTRLMTEAVHQRAVLPPSTLSSGHGRPPHSTIVQTVQAMFAEGGLPIFWRGMSANLLGLSHVAVQFPVYERLKQQIRLSNPDQHQLSATDLLVASGLSKMTASLLTYPHEVIRSRMMDARTKGNVKFRATCRTIFRQDGVAGFYAGLPVSLLRVIPNTCLTFVTYELVLRWSRQHFLETATGTNATAIEPHVGSKRASG